MAVVLPVQLPADSRRDDHVLGRLPLEWETWVQFLLPDLSGPVLSLAAT